ncbi:MAG: DUF2971 domain-containing protein [Sphingomonas sp.]|uniref:DUF2971 domain-containing protein n=1 Tax=Sphingomonas sp. TaxID=28214 RepID=UPI001AD12986|nr:DUF2971 domain-containing protein [Sphingomonas sp.]MBN8815964.1 DUF2971 domain-containing protein [Sphingomonas sp.]
MTSQATTTPSGATLINLEPGDLDILVHRTFSFDRFVDLLRSRENGLVSPGLWDDPFENFLLAHTLVRTPDGELGTLEPLAADWYGQCWTGTADSDAMWRIYSATHTGIKATARLGDLLDGLAVSARLAPSLQAFAGRVEYHDQQAIAAHMSSLTFTDLALGGTNDRFAELLCVKREAFAHEDEIRLLYCDVEPKQADGTVFRYGFDPNSVLKSIEVDPRMSHQEAATVIGKLRAEGLTVPAARSTLYDAPSFTIPLE